MGRKRTIMLGLLANTVGAILQISAYHLPQMIIGRVINGFGMGMLFPFSRDRFRKLIPLPGLTSATCPIYQAECSKPRIRGKLVVVGSLCNTAAFCLANWMNYGLYFSGGALQWRFPLAFQLIFPIMVIAVLPFLPETPRWLLLQDRQDEALQVIARLAGKNVSIHDSEVNAEFLSIRTAIAEERESRMPTKDVLQFKDKTQNFRRLLLSCGTQMMQQFSGVNALGMFPYCRTQVIAF